MEKKCSLIISNTEQTLEVREGVELSKELDATNSPILFGCRTGICGTCLLMVEEGSENTNEASSDEKEFLEIVTDDPRARLGCLLKCHGTVKVKYIGK